jgi:MATE family multidrug resistance protein
VELAGASIGRSIGFGAASMTMGIGMALEPLASQALGAGEPGRAWGAFGATLKAIALSWLPVCAVAMGITYLLEPMGVDREVVTRARLYLIGQLPGLGLYGVFIAARTFLQAHGNARPALVAALVANVLNWVVCSLLVRGDDALRIIGLPAVGLPALGSFGAGLATTIAETVLVTITVRAARARHAGGASEHVPVSTVLRIGLPVGLQLFAEIGIFALVALVSGRLGPVVASAHQVAIGLASFTYMGSIGVSAATAVRVGHAVGEGRSPRRVGLLGIGVGAGLQAIGAIVFALIPRALVGVFTPDPAVLALGARLMLIAAVFQLFDGMQGVASGALRGAGDVRFAFLSNVVGYWFFGVPLALWLLIKGVAA